MPARLTLAKTARPSLTGILPRRRLFALLDERAPAVWVSGPPGCGKTTLVASWLDHAAVRGYWYQLDDGDADVASFFYHLGAAADQGRGEPLPLLSPEQRTGLPQFARRYFQRLFMQLESPFAVVFDGCQEVAASSALHEVLRIAIEQLPPGGSMILVSRGDPPGELARLRANRALRFIGWEDLRLTRGETKAIAAKHMPKLSAASLEALYSRTEGWAAGVVLMLQQARSSGAIEKPPATTRKLVFDYLAGEIFQKSDQPTQQFLLRTAFLPWVSPNMAAALTGSADTQRMLEELRSQNYFVTLREMEGEPVYQYHPMLRDFLQSRAEELLGKDQRRQLQRACARELEAAGQVADAAALYRDSHDWAALAGLVERHAAALLAHGRAETLARWFEELPAEMHLQRPWTVYWAACSRAASSPREARLLFEKAFDLFRAGADAKGVVLACAGTMDAILYELDDFSLLDRWIAVLDDAVHAAPLGSAELDARVACSMFVSLTLRQPQRHDIGTWIERALLAAQQVADVNVRMATRLLAAVTLMWTGLHGRALELIAATRRLATGPGVSTFSLLTLRTAEAMYGALTADEACDKAVRDGLAMARTTGVQVWTFQLLAYGYAGALGRGDLRAAASLGKQLAPLAGGAGRFNLCLFRYLQCWEALLRRDAMQALEHGKTALRMAIEVGCPYFETLCRLAVAEALAECGDERRCVMHLHAVRGLARGIQNRHLEFTCLIGAARLAMEHGRVRTGLNALRHGLELGRRYGYTHFLGWRPSAIAGVLGHALVTGIESEYVRSLVKRRRLAPERSIDDWPWTFKVRTFGGFRLLRHNEPLGETGKAQRRPLELLKALIAHGGENVPEGRLTDELWPRVDGDCAHRSFTSALHRLRRLLGEERAIVLHEGRVTLDRRYFWIDTWALEELLRQLDDPIDATSIAQIRQRLFDCYRGPFLAESDAAWCLAPRERLRKCFIRAVSRLYEYTRTRGQPEIAREIREKAVELEPLAVYPAAVSHP